MSKTIDIKSLKPLKVKTNKKELLWDGTYLGVFKPNDIIHKQVIRGKKYWKIEIDGHYIVVIVRIITSAIPCILDELKPLFNLPKLGTHYIKCKNSLYLLVRPQWTTNDKGKMFVQEEETLKICQARQIKTEEFREQVKQVYTFL